MDAAAALADLTEICSQVEAAVVLDTEGAVLAAVGDGERLARVGSDLLAAAQEDFGARRSVTKLEVALHEASVFVLREGGLVLVARTSAGPRSNCPTASRVKNWLRNVVLLPGPPPVSTNGSV